ncbi:helix-turn-helix transcriptional regulator [Enterococcus casseliflavus]|jgi:DNA-binding transcriptional ArsR family regulator|nr:helix-turn-helix transcriptional regulator [Enterococcus casseliflavus]
MKESFLDLLRESTSFFSTLQEENRQEIVSLLFENGGMSVTEITDKMDLSRPAISHHLKLLLQTDLVYFEKRGKERVYFLNVECVKRNVERFMNLLNQF